jgi:hypothetical protein
MVAPGPGGVDAQHELTPGSCESCGNVEQAVAQRLGFSAGEITVETDEFCPCEKVRRDDRRKEPRLVVDVVLERQIFGSTDAFVGG